MGSSFRGLPVLQALQAVIRNLRKLKKQTSPVFIYTQRPVSQILNYAGQCASVTKEGSGWDSSGL